MTSTDLALRNDLSKHIEILTSDGVKELNKDILKKVKNICKLSEEYVEHAFHVIMVQMEKEHSEVRYSTLLLTHEFFKRSHMFRKLLLTDFQTFLELCAETDEEQPLPPPKAVAKNLKIKTLELVQQWCDQYGEDYKRLKLAYNFLKNCKQVNFANLHAQSVIAQRRNEEARQQQENIVRDRVNKTVLEMSEKSPEIESVLKQIENCFHILIPTINDIDLESPSTSKRSQPMNVDSGSFDVSTSNIKNNAETDEIMRHHGLKNMKHSFSIQVAVDPCIQTNEDNDAVIDNLNDLMSQVEKCFLPTIKKWLQILTKGTNCTCTGSLKKAVDLKKSLLSSVQKYKELQILPEQPQIDSDEEFEIVKEKEGYEPVIPSDLRKEYGLEPLPRTKTQTIESKNEKSKDTNGKSPSSIKSSKDEILNDELKDPTSLVSNLHSFYKKAIEKLPENIDTLPSCSKSVPKDPNKIEMLSKAPRMPYDIDLYHWEDEKIEPPTVLKFDTSHKFWQSASTKERQEIKIKDGVDALRKRKIEFCGEFVPVKWVCSVPLPNGKLCPRQDRYKCPFHGKIIPRDMCGNPVNPEDVEKPVENIEESIPDWQDPELLRDLEAATGVDLRMPKKRGKKEDSNKCAPKRRKRFPNLTDIKEEENTTRKRLEKKVFDKRTVQRVSEKMDSLDKKKYNDKFGDQWVYSFLT